MIGKIILFLILVVILSVALVYTNVLTKEQLGGILYGIGSMIITGLKIVGKAFIDGLLKLLGLI